MKQRKKMNKFKCSIEKLCRKDGGKTEYPEECKKDEEMRQTGKDKDGKRDRHTD